MIIVHYCDYVGAEHRSAFLEAFASLELDERWRVRRVLVEKTQVKSATMHDSDRAHTAFFHRRLATLLGVEVDQLAQLLHEMKNAILLDPASEVGHVLNKRAVAGNQSIGPTLQTFCSTTDALRHLDLPREFSWAFP